jgi:hypothetical protein
LKSTPLAPEQQERKNTAAQNQDEEEKINDLSENEAKQNDKKSKTVNFTLRLDVVRKSIFRAMKKYYVNDFKKSFNFTQRKKKDSNIFNKELVEEAQKYLDGKWPENPLDSLCYYLIALIDTKQKYVPDYEAYPSVCSNINSMLRSFNTKKAKNLFAQKEFSYLLLNYFKTENIQQLLDERKDAESRAIYQAEVKAMIEHASKVVSS